MWSLLTFFCLTITWIEAQNGRVAPHQEHNGHGWDIRLAVPGEPGNDYPTLGTIPRTSFSCAGREPGYYADVETNCQVFRVCTVGSTYGFQSFLCPNGTLFNQAVFVCDWWMNVNCKNSQQFVNNNELFGNLRLGPQLMKDIKKMLTHPMLNPYDRNAMKSNLIVMQDYKPPVGQLFPNGALFAGPERTPNNVYLPAKQTFSASTPGPRYIPAPDNNFQTFPRDDDYFQRQKQSEQYIRSGQDSQSLQNNNLISNSHAGRFIQNSELYSNNDYTKAPQMTIPTQITNISQKPSNFIQNSQMRSTQNNRRSQANRQRAQYSEPRRIQPSNDKQTDFGVTFTEPINTKNSNASQDKQSYSYSTPSSSLPQFSNDVMGKAGRELKENLVSTIQDTKPTMATKTYNKYIQETRIAKPKSRVTIKTWIVKPTKAGRQLIDPKPYSYATPYPSLAPSSPYSTSPREILTDETTPYLYEKPTSSYRTEKIISSELDSEEPYTYPKPTPAANLIQTSTYETTRVFVAPTMSSTRSIFSGRFSLPSTPVIPTKASRYYLAPSAFKSVDRYYLPPARNPTILPRLYLSPDTAPQPVYYQNAQLIAIPPLSTSTRLSLENSKDTSLSLSKQPQIVVDHNNLTFADILTKNKLDVTVNNIVKDTDNILKTASPPPQNKYRKNSKSLDSPETNLADKLQEMKTTKYSAEILTSQSPSQSTMMISNNPPVIATPITILVPPNESFIYQNNNELSKLPFFKESGFPNTIERTVTIKITIPEKIAMYLFKNQREPDYEKLEILNTGSSNYLVLSNNQNKISSMKNTFNFIPVAKLSDDTNIKNISDSQAFVYSFLADSINVAREYRNLAQQEILSTSATPTTAQFPNIDNAKLSDITNRISDLTSSQFSSNNFNPIDKSAKLINTPSNHITNQPFAFTDNIKYSNKQNQDRQLQSPEHNIPSLQTQNEVYSSNSPTFNNQHKLQNNQLYSGQLYQWPVPEVTKQIYNKPNHPNLIHLNNIQQQTTQMLTLQHNTNQNNAAGSFKQSSPVLEIIKAQTLPIYSTKLQLEPLNESDQITSQENLTNLLNRENGISAHLQDKIVGSLPHPLEENKVVTFEKDQSYYVYTKFNDNSLDRNPSMNIQSDTHTQQNINNIQNDNEQNAVSFQFIPSVNYELEDEKEQQNILDAFQIDEFGAPREISKSKSITEDKTARQLMMSVDYSVEHPTKNRRSDRYNVDTLYSGPSSYTAPQSSIGSLINGRNTQNDYSSRLEDFDTNSANGYPKERPARQFVF